MVCNCIKMDGQMPACDTCICLLFVRRLAGRRVVSFKLWNSSSSLCYSATVCTQWVMPKHIDLQQQIYEWNEQVFSSYCRWSCRILFNLDVCRRMGTGSLRAILYVTRHSPIYSIVSGRGRRFVCCSNENEIGFFRLHQLLLCIAQVNFEFEFRKQLNWISNLIEYFFFFLSFLDTESTHTRTSNPTKPSE